MAPTIENHSECELQGALDDGERRRVPPRSTSFFNGRVLGLASISGRRRHRSGHLTF
jgi:hypothetical protein